MAMKTHLKEIVNVRQIDINDLSDKTCIHKNVLECIIEGDVDPTLRQLMALSNALSLTIDEIVTGTINAESVLKKTLLLYNDIQVITCYSCRLAYILYKRLQNDHVRCNVFYREYEFDEPRYYVVFTKHTYQSISVIIKLLKDMYFCKKYIIPIAEMRKEFTKL